MLHKIKRADGDLEIDLDEKHRYWLNGKQLSGGTKVARDLPVHLSLSPLTGPVVAPGPEQKRFCRK